MSSLYPDFTNLKKPRYELSKHLGSSGGAELRHNLLKDLVNADATLIATSICQSVSAHGDILTLRFDVDLSTPTQTDVLTAVLAAYVYVAADSERGRESSDETSISSGDFVPIDDVMTITPEAGTYVATFSASGSHDKKGVEAHYAIFVGGVIVPNSDRKFGGGGKHTKKFSAAMHSQAEVTVDGSQAIDVRCHDGGDGEFTCYERSLVLK